MKIVLVYSDYTPTDTDAVRRYAAARKTWGSLLQYGVKTTGVRCSAAIGDEINVPSFNFLMDRAFERYPDHVTAFINNDILLGENAADRMLETITKAGGVCLGLRRDVGSGEVYYFGVDVVAVTPLWWWSHRQDIPEMFIAVGAWDKVFRTYCERLAGPTCYADDFCWHEHHETTIVRAKGGPARSHNLRQAEQFFRSIGQTAQADKYKSELQAECAEIDPKMKLQ